MLKTKSGLPKHCCYSVDRHGKLRVKFQKKGFSTYIKGTPWSEDFMKQYAAARRHQGDGQGGRGRAH